MKTRKIQVKANQLNSLIGDVRAVPAEPVGYHLSDDQFIDYAAETLTPEEVQQTDQHLASCPDCAEEMERFVAASEVWRGEPGKQRLAALRERLQPVPPPALALYERFSEALQQAQESWQALFPKKPANEELARLPLAAATFDEERREIWNWQSEDGSLRGHAVLAGNGDLTFRFESKELNLDGRRFHLRLGSLPREMVWQRVSETEVGAKIVIPRSERLSDTTEISLEMD
jgi:anti-sigma factor RsiW